jgi:5-methylcytosine-specific restriction endonuclease McrA
MVESAHVSQEEVVMPRKSKTPKDYWREGKDWDVFVRDKYTCRDCRRSMTALNQIGQVNRWDLFTADHLKCRNRKGNEVGPGEVINLVTACMGCNRIKGYTFDRTYKGAAPTTLEEQEKLVQEASQYIKVERERLAADCIAMQREGGLPS